MLLTKQHPFDTLLGMIARIHKMIKKKKIQVNLIECSYDWWYSNKFMFQLMQLNGEQVWSCRCSQYFWKYKSFIKHKEEDTKWQLLASVGDVCVCVRLCLAFRLHSRSLKMQRESKARQKFSCELVTKSYFGKFGIWLDTIVISLLC